MPDLNDELQELHRDVVAAVRDRINAGEPSTEDLRTALQLLKQNQVSAVIPESAVDAMKAQMAKKLDFSALSGKVVPIKGDEKKHRA